MGQLPIPADMYFQDFAFDVLEYSVSDGGSVVGTYRGLSNTDETGDYIGFLVKDQPQISVGSTLSTIDGLAESRFWSMPSLPAHTSAVFCSSEFSCRFQIKSVRTLGHKAECFPCVVLRGALGFYFDFHFCAVLAAVNIAVFGHKIIAPLCGLLTCDFLPLIIAL